MSIQTTIQLTRKEAEERLLYKREKEERERIRKQIIANLTDKELENELEEEFYNFWIISEEK